MVPNPLLGLQPLWQHHRGKFLGPEPCEFQMGGRKKFQSKDFFLIIFSEIKCADYCTKHVLRHQIGSFH